MNFFGYIEDDANNGTGIRLTIFISGCNHNCDGCHSPESHDFHYGKEFTIEEQDNILDIFTYVLVPTTLVFVIFLGCSTGVIAL